MTHAIDASADTCNLLKLIKAPVVSQRRCHAFREGASLKKQLESWWQRRADLNGYTQPVSRRRVDSVRLPMSGVRSFNHERENRCREISDRLEARETMGYGPILQIPIPAS
jgi:hypothetical protein